MDFESKDSIMSLEPLIQKYELVEKGEYQGLRLLDSPNKGTFFTTSGHLVTCKHVLDKRSWKEDFIQPDDLDLLVSKKTGIYSPSSPKLAVDWRWSKNIPCKLLIVDKNEMRIIEGILGLDWRRSDVTAFTPNNDDDYKSIQHGHSGSPILREDNNVVGILTSANVNEQLIGAIGLTSRSVTLPIQEAGIRLFE